MYISPIIKPSILNIKSIIEPMISDNDPVPITEEK